jgi:hypothetical protein
MTYGRIAYRCYPACYFNPLIFVLKILKNNRKKEIVDNKQNPKKMVIFLKKSGHLKNGTRVLLQHPEIFFRGIYLKITRNSYGVDNMDRMIGQIYRNTLQQFGGPVDASTFPGALS